MNEPFQREFDYESGFHDGRKEMKTEVLAIIRQCLPADPSLDKLIKAIEALA